MSDEELISRIRAGDTALFEVVMRRYNTRIYRVARAIVKNDDEAEDVMQQAYVNAFTHLDQFADRAKFSTWLTRIAVYEALGRARRAGRWREAERGADDEGGVMDPIERLESSDPTPERAAYARELGAVLETAVLALPDHFRAVFMLREVDGLSTLETADCLGLNEATVKTRLSRARALLRRQLAAWVGGTVATAFEFHAIRCDRIVFRVMARIAV